MQAGQRYEYTVGVVDAVDNDLRGVKRTRMFGHRGTEVRGIQQVCIQQEVGHCRMS